VPFIISKADNLSTADFENYLNKIVLMQSQPVFMSAPSQLLDRLQHHVYFMLCFFQIVKERIYSH